MMLGAGVVSTTPAYAATCPEDTACNTTTTFAVTADVLDITIPDATTLSSGAAPGGFASGNLGAITVTDERAAADASWTATVTSTAFTTGTEPFDASETVPTTNVYYCSGAATSTSGSGTFTPGQTGCAAPPPATGQNLSAARTAFSHTGGTGVNTAAWNPLITTDPEAEDIAGTYTGTITHTIS
jgi:hypothetical protein